MRRGREYKLSSNPDSACVPFGIHHRSRRSWRFTAGSIHTKTATRPVIAIRMRSEMMRRETGPTSPHSSLCSRKSACPFSPYMRKLLSRRVTSLSDLPEDDDCDVTSLLDRLNSAMVAYRPGLRDYLRNALIPTVHHQTRLHNTLRERIDTSFATGILSIDQVCKNIELFRLKDEDEVANFHSGVKVRIYSGLSTSAVLIPCEG